MQTIELPVKQRKKRPVREPKFQVILHNDDYNTVDHVVRVLLRVLNCTVQQAVQCMAEAHHTGQAIIYTGSLANAELIKDRILGHAPDANSPADCAPTRLIASLQKVPE